MIHKVLRLGLIVVLGMGATQLVQAGTVKIDVSNNGSGSSNSVSINSNSQNADSTTDVTIRTNGEVQTFRAEGDEDINYQSEDGSVRVNVNSESSVETSTDVEVIEEAQIATDSPNLAEQSNEVVPNEPETFIEKILHQWNEWNEAFKSSLRNLFS